MIILFFTLPAVPQLNRKKKNKYLGEKKQLDSSFTYEKLQQEEEEEEEKEKVTKLLRESELNLKDLCVCLVLVSVVRLCWCSYWI
uniref:Uncharacterized protein n=1 Tax=Megaselia scalaris TaxID=36166 RepID=T1GWF1_MEGSC